MRKKKNAKSVWDLFNQLRASLAFNLPVKFPKTVESEMESEDFQFLPTSAMLEVGGHIPTVIVLYYKF